MAIRDELDLFFSDPMSSETAKDGFLVLKANIHVTLAMIRLRLILHREDLLNRSGAVGTTSRHAAELVASDLGENVDWRHLVYQDLFKAVHCIPIQAVSTDPFRACSVRRPKDADADGSLRRTVRRSWRRLGPWP